VVRQQVIARLDAEARDIERRPVLERLAAPYRMDTSDEAAEPLERVLVLQFGGASASARIDRKSEARMMMQRPPFEDERRHHRNLALGEFLRESMLFQNLRIAPTRRPVELCDHRRFVFEPHLIDAVLVTVERELPP